MTRFITILIALIIITIWPKSKKILFYREPLPGAIIISVVFTGASWLLEDTDPLLHGLAVFVFAFVVLYLSKLIVEKANK